MEPYTTGITRPPKICIYGEHGIGKSSFGAECPNPIFLQTEDGLQGLKVKAFPLATSLSQVYEALSFLMTQKHDYKTLVIDSVDWLEKLIFRAVCEENGVTDIAAPGLGYGRGYRVAAQKWDVFLNKLTELISAKKMLVVLIAHAMIKKFEDPETQSFDKYQLDLQERGASTICEWCDIVGFCKQKIVVTKESGSFGAETVRGKTTGERLLCLEGVPAYEAKNRYGLPPSIPMIKGQTWKTLAQHLAKASKKEEGDLADLKHEKEVKTLTKGEIENGK